MDRKTNHNLAWELVTVLKTQIFSTDENFKKSSHLFTSIFLPSWWFTAMQSNGSSLPIIYNLHVMPLLVNVMFPSEHSRFTMACRAFHA